MKISEETGNQIAVFDWLRAMNLDKVAFHIANERACSPQYGALLKRMGTKAGVSDIFIARKSRAYIGAWIEMKSAKGKLTPKQKEFLEAAAQEGYYTKVAYSSEEAINAIKWYLQM